MGLHVLNRSLVFINRVGRGGTLRILAPELSVMLQNMTPDYPAFLVLVATEGILSSNFVFCFFHICIGDGGAPYIIGNRVYSLLW